MKSQDNNHVELTCSEGLVLLRIIKLVTNKVILEKEIFQQGGACFMLGSTHSLTASQPHSLAMTQAAGAQ